MSRCCAALGCSNGSYKLEKWKAEQCAVHNCKHNEEACICLPPFKLFPFPTLKKNPEMREKWKKMINRVKSSTSKCKSTSELFEPGRDSRVCSFHFIDGHPSVKNPIPTLNLGYDASHRASLFSPPFRSRPVKRKECVDACSLEQSFPLQPSSSSTDRKILAIHFDSSPVAATITTLPTTQVKTLTTSQQQVVKKINKSIHKKIIGNNMKKKENSSS